MNLFDLDCNEFIFIESDQSYNLQFPSYVITPTTSDCQWTVTVQDGHRIQIVFIEVFLEPYQGKLSINAGDRAVVYDGVNDDFSDLESSGSSVRISYLSDYPTSGNKFWLKLTHYNPGKHNSLIVISQEDGTQDLRLNISKTKILTIGGDGNIQHFLVDGT